MESRRILVVDDEPGLLLTVAANFELEGFEVLTAQSAEEALETLGQESVDLLLSDVRMPGMSGLDLFREVKKLRPDTPFVMMTAFALEDVVEQAMQEGVFTVLPKPFDIEHVLGLVARAMKRPLVLVIDDDSPVALSTAAALESLGVRACSSSDPEAAIRTVREGLSDVCVVDLLMPGMDGAEVTRRLKEISPDVAVIAVSGHGVEELISRVAALGAFACLRKPVAPTKLAEMVAKARGTAAAAGR